MLEIGALTREDVAAAAEIERELRTAWSEEAIAGCLADGAIRYITAKKEGRVVGVCSFVASVDAQIINIAVAGEHRGGGVGKALMSAAQDTAMQRGAASLTLEAQENTAAVGFYEHLGFTINAKRKNFYGEGKDAVCMIKFIKPKEYR